MKTLSAHADPTTAYRDQVLGSLLPGVAHEWANPLGFVGANLEALRRYSVRLGAFFAELHFRARRAPVSAQDLAALKERQQIPAILEDLPGLLDQCVEGLAQNRRLLEALRVFLVPRPEPEGVWSVADLFAAARALAWNRTKRTLEVTAQLEGLPSVDGRRSDLVFVFLALLLNAARAVGRRGRLLAEGGRGEEGLLAVHLQDDGPGIPPDQREAVFAPGFSAWPDQPGTGLGLTVARAYARAHGGDLYCTDSAWPRGARFTLVLPVAEGTP